VNTKKPVLEKLVFYGFLGLLLDIVDLCDIIYNTRKIQRKRIEKGKDNLPA
jgi:hypothetical protein